MSKLFERSPRFFARRWWLGAGVLVLVVPAIAQAQAPSVDECNEFAEIVNRNQAIFDTFETDIETFSSELADAETLDEIRDAAARYVDAVDLVTDDLNTFVSDLDALTFTDEPLATYRDDYADVVTGFEEALSIVASAMDNVAESTSEAELADNLEAVQTDTTDAISDIDTLAVAESNVIDGLNAYCGADAAE